MEPTLALASPCSIVGRNTGIWGSGTVLPSPLTILVTLGPVTEKTVMKAVKTDFIQDHYNRREETAAQNRLEPQCSVGMWEWIAKEQGGGRWVQIAKRRCQDE